MIKKRGHIFSAAWCFLFPCSNADRP